MSKKTTNEATKRALKPSRFHSAFKRAAQLAEDHITERALNIHELIDSTGVQYNALVREIDPGLTQRAAQIEAKILAALPQSKRELIEEYERIVIEEQDAERQAAYLIGVAVGMRLAGGAR